jgi:hypothetical protein
MRSRCGRGLDEFAKGRGKRINRVGRCENQSGLGHLCR